jgi:hypothetical protein
VGLLVSLGLFQAVGQVHEIGAAILAVTVEEEFVKLVLKVVVMGDVALRAHRLVAAEQPLQPLDLALFEDRAALPAIFPAVGADDQLEKVEDRPILDRQPSIHIGFAQRQPRILDQVKRDPSVGETDRQCLAAARPIGFATAVGLDQRDPPFGQQGSDQTGYQRHACTPMPALAWPVRPRRSSLRLRHRSASVAFSRQPS